MVLPELTFFHFVAAGILLYVLGAFLRAIGRWWKRLRAKRHFNQYQSERDAYYNATSGARPTSDRHNQSAYPPQDGVDYVKDRDTKVQDIAEPKGFWTRFVMNEKMNLIREMIRISNSTDHKGYWQDRIEAQKRVEGKNIGEDKQQR